MWGVVSLMVAGFFMLIVACTGFPGGVLKDYSDGTRAGQITKLSHKGLFWKSWEAQMNMGGTVQGENGAVASVFAFNVDSAVVPQIQSALESGKRVKVIYRQWLIQPLSIDNRSVVVQVKSTE